ncbi:MAG: PAS domain S-box protein [Nitrospirota bacterium]
MNKEKYIQEQLSTLLRSLYPLLIIIGASTDMLLSILDYFVTPENFSKFFIYRLITASLTMAIYFITTFKKGKYFHFIFVFLGFLITGAMVEAMILSFGGHQSIYYVGIGLILAFFLGFLPLSLGQAGSIAGSLYAIYLIPIIILDDIVNVRIFINNNIFLITFALGGLTWRYIAQRLLVNKISLQYELEEQKKKLEDYSIQLEKYSTQLEELVRERTKQLSISEERFRALFDNANDGVAVLDRNGTIINVNKKFCELHGFDKNVLVGTHYKFIEVEDAKEEKDERLRRLLNGESLVFETQHYKRDGTRIFLEVSSKGINVGEDYFIQSFHRDISEKKAIQEQLIHAQKMETVGQLTGGIAHNFNNLITAILGYAELLIMHSNLDDNPRQKVINIENIARKAGIIVSKLMSFSRRDILEFWPISLNDVINDAVNLIEGVLEKRIGLKITLTDKIPYIEADQNHIEQILMNFISNSKDAMPEGGLITITTGTTEVKKGELDIPTYIPDGKYVLLTVSDTGSGIPKDIIQRIFDPFFTTKEKGKGTGLGLATVYGIVKELKGYITVQSEVGKGTTFYIYFPISAKKKAPPDINKSQHISLLGNEKILVVDDDEDVLGFFKDVLETHGYKVMPANNPIIAIEIFNKMSKEIDIVITDIMMPLMDGRELIRNLKDIKPNIKIISASGFSGEAIDKNKMKIDAFIKKPIEINNFLTTVRHTLDRGTEKLPLY